MSKRKRGGASVPCICSKSAPSRVLDTRRRQSSVIRLRVCVECGKQFKTREKRVS